ncbi:MAG: class I SAM-dependent methyltransferase [Candidatus Latescibacteria bacterium]|nr:class I SAM-dependent methyltransferase [Candidatus Latescibacterota bacterium]
MKERHELNPRTRFSNRVDDYIRYRPGYPPELLAWLREAICLSPSWRVADIGSGTGLLSSHFLEAGCTLIGVEPNAAMRAAAERAFAENPRFVSVAGSAEATTLADHSIDLVSAGQAFHWFEPVATRREWRRILKPAGYALVVFNSRLIEATPFMRAYDQYLIDHAVDYTGVDHRRGVQEKLHSVFDGYQEKRFRFTLRHRYDDVRGLSMSSSYVPAPGHPRHEAFFAGLQEIFDAHATDGVVDFPYETEAYVGRV